MKILVQHNLSQAAALNRIKIFAVDLEKQFAGRMSDVAQTWTGANGHLSFKINNVKVSGQLTVTPSDIKLIISVPFVFSFFKSQFKPIIEEKLKNILS